MKKQFLIGAVALLLVSASAFIIPKKENRYTVDAKTSTVVWLAKKLAGEHTGNLTIKSGELTLDKGKLIGGSFEVDMASITDTDIKDAGTNAKLVGHLKSEDFFNAAKFPTAALKITAVTEKSKGKYEVTADLTIKDITKPITFMTTITEKKGSATAEAAITVDRTKYDIRYRSKTFFESIGDKIIYDEFTLTVKLSTTIVK